MVSRVLPLTAVAILAGLVAAHGQSPAVEPTQSTVDADGTVHLPAMSVPVSTLSTPESKRSFLDFARGMASLSEGLGKGADISTLRQRLDDRMLRPGVAKLRAAFAVDIKPQKIGGVHVEVIEPASGVATKNERRVLINLHGGGFMSGAGFGGEMESIPIASLGAIKVIAVDYRLWPEFHFPAASEDVAAVYRELLKTYRASNIGIYGCSAGGMLTAEAVAWFQAHGLPRPGAIGILGSGALVPMVGDSNYIASMLTGVPSAPEDAKKFLPYFNLTDLNVKDPLVSPAYSPSVLASFPPTLLVSGTRDIGLSPAVYTHVQLIKQGVDADLHVWEGATHCSFANPIADPTVPETREAWDVIVKFFDKRLGR